MVSLVEVLGGEHLQGMVSREHGPDAVRSRRCLAVPGAFDEVHLRGARSQGLRTFDVQEQPGSVADDDQALGRDLPELIEQHVYEGAERMLGPALPHLAAIRLERSQQIGRIQTGVQRPLPGIDDRQSHACIGRGPRLSLQLTTGEQTLPALTKLSSACARIRSRYKSQPLGRHGPAIIAPRSRSDRMAMNAAQPASRSMKSPRRPAPGMDASLVPQPGLLDVREVLVRPVGQRDQQLGRRPAEGRQRVLDADGNLCVHGAVDEPVTLEAAQGVREHLLRCAPEVVIRAGCSDGRRGRAGTADRPSTSRTEGRVLPAYARSSRGPDASAPRSAGRGAGCHGRDRPGPTSAPPCCLLPCAGPPVAAAAGGRPVRVWSPQDG